MPPTYGSELQSALFEVGTLILFLTATHGTEVPYLYNEVDELSTEAELILSQNMIDYFISFVVNLDPNDQYGNVSRKLINFFIPSIRLLLIAYPNNRCSVVPIYAFKPGPFKFTSESSLPI